MALDMLVFYGSVRTERQGIKAARFMVNKIRERDQNVSFIDPLEYRLPLLDWMYKEYEKGKAPEPLETLAEMIRNADAFVIVSGEYNHSIPPPLTNLMDHFLEEYFFRPSAIASYSSGAFGGVRAAMQLRAFLAEIGTVSIPTLFPIPHVQDAFRDDGEPVNPKLHDYVKQFLDELEWYAFALKEARASRGRPY